MKDKVIQRTKIVIEMIANIRNKVISILLPKLKQFINSIFVNLLTVLFGAVSGLLLLISTGRYTFKC